MMALRKATDRSAWVPSYTGARKVARTPKVLCATDLSPRSEGAVWRAHAIARRLGAQLLLLHVVAPAESVRAIRRHGAEARFTLDAQARKLARWGNAAQTSVRAGRPLEVISDVAIKWDPDLIVLGAYRRRPGDSFRGTFAERVVRQTERPVLVVNRESAGPYERVLLTSDRSRMSAGIARVTRQLGLLEHSQGAVVHALRHPRRALPTLAGVSESDVNEYQRSLRQLASSEIETQLESAGLNSARFSIFSPQSSPFRAIEQIGQHVGSDLVVVGSSRFPLLKRMFIGSVSNEVLRRIKHDVLLVSPAAAQRQHSGYTLVYPWEADVCLEPGFGSGTARHSPARLP
jgi:nucleotide-binding universal stress UspA family protein